MLSLLQFAARTALAGMAWLPSGSYRPLRPEHGQARVTVEAFALDRHAVSRGEFLAFVRQNRAWRRSMADSTLVESSYLADWPSDLDAGDAIRLREPVTGVSQYAASAYCAARGKRLPTTDEWEYVAAASETQRDATNDPAFIRRLLSLYQAGGQTFRNVYGVSGLHGGGWEWTADVHAASVTAQPHHARLEAPTHDATCAGAAIGAGDATNYPAFLRDAVRASLTPRSATQHLGFRCAL
jgi:formylglycine-generating enzyme required for sulfatase activity